MSLGDRKVPKPGFLKSLIPETKNSFPLEAWWFLFCTFNSFQKVTIPKKKKVTIHLVITLVIPKALQNSSESDIHLTNSN